MKISKELLKGSTAIMILKTIAEEDSYGYQIVQQIAAKSENLFKLNEGTLYPLLHTMEKEGWIESYRSAGDGGRERKYYRITPSGKLKLALQIEEWKSFAQAVNGVLSEEV